MFVRVFKKAIYAYSTLIFKLILSKIRASEIGYRIVGGAFWSLAGAVISRGLIFSASVFIARILGKTSFGELGMVQSTAEIFGIFIGLGLGLTVNKYIAQFRYTDPSRAGRIMGISNLAAIVIGGLVALIFFSFAPWFAKYIINAPDLANMLRIAATILFISILNSVQTGTLSGFEAFKTIARINFFVGLISFPIILIGAYFWGLAGVVWALAINLCLNWFFSQLAVRKEAARYKVSLTFRGCSRELSLLWSFSLPAVLAGLLVGFATWTSNAMLVNQPNGYEEMGILTAALIFQSALLFTSNMLNAPLLSIVSNVGLKISEKLGSVNILSSWILGVVIAIPLLCFPELAEIMFSKGYHSYSFKVTFSLVVFCTAIIMFKAGLARILTAKSLLWWGVLSNAFWAVTFIIASVFLVHLGASGLAASLAIAYILNTAVFMPLYYLRNLVPRKILISFEATAIWSILIILVFLNIINASLSFRTVAFVPLFAFAVIAFSRLTKGYVPALVNNAEHTGSC